jgi:hypothetical protein
MLEVDMKKKLTKEEWLEIVSMAREIIGAQDPDDMPALEEFCDRAEAEVRRMRRA